MKIYTKTGDDGTTALANGSRVGKDHIRVDLYGEIDELNAAIGLSCSFLEDKDLKKILSEIQKHLMSLGSILAHPENKQNGKANLSSDHISYLEQEIDKIDKALSPLKNFILPTGSSAASALHMARTISRRVERKLIAAKDKLHLEKLYYIYMNRLSDYLFTASRYANMITDTEEIFW